MSQTGSGPHPGDDGRSDLLGAERPAKDAPVFECLGWLDELNSALGHLRTAIRASEPGDQGDLDADLRGVQLVLGRIMATVAADPPPEAAGNDQKQDLQALDGLERALRSSTDIRPVFSVPGDGCAAAAVADVARARCRTAERALVRFAAGRSALVTAQRYLNRLSDYLFVVARHLDADGD